MDEITKTLRTGRMTADMGSCQCGDVDTRYIIDTKYKKVIVLAPWGESWMKGQILEDEYHVPYAGKVKLPGSGYEIVVVDVGRKNEVIKMRSTTVKITELQAEILIGFLDHVYKQRRKHMHRVAVRKIMDNMISQMR